MITSLTTPQDLAYLLGTTYNSLCYSVYKIDTAYLYTSFQIEKKNGGTRIIHAPIPRLKHLQKRLKSHLEKLYKPHAAASAFIPERGIYYNAKFHTKSIAVFNIDLTDFYDHIHFGRVKGLLTARPYSLQESTARIIAHICCVGGKVPQGAPTSPLISNMICRRMDKELAHFAKQQRAHYTRYADDITFSFKSKNSAQKIYSLDGTNPAPSNDLIHIIKNNGFQINPKKTRLQTSRERQTVTGLKVNQKVNLDRRFIRKTKAMLHSLQLDPERASIIYSDRNPETNAVLERVVGGRINYIGMIKGKYSPVYKRLAVKFNNLNCTQKLPLADRQKLPDNIENRLHFYPYQHRLQLEQSIWVICFDDTEGASEDAKLLQATGFMIEGQRLLTATHTFVKAGFKEACTVYKIKETSKRYQAAVVSMCTGSDITELKILTDEPTFFSYLKLAPSTNIFPGFRVAVAGFPQLLAGHQSVTIIQCTVTNVVKISALTYFNVDTEFQAGISGSPILNGYMQVAGMALRGPSHAIDPANNEIVSEGSSAFISLKHFPKPQDI